MAPQSKHTIIKASKRQLVDEHTDTEHSNDNQTQLSGSIYALNVYPELKAQMPQTRATARAAKIQVRDNKPSQSDKEGGDDESEQGTPQMTP